MSPEHVSYRTKIVDVWKVRLRGALRYDDGWKVGKDELEEWLGKFDGKSVALEITLLEGGDESHLLPSTQERLPAPQPTEGA